MRFISGSVLTCLLLSSVAPVWAQQSPARPIIDKPFVVSMLPDMQQQYAGWVAGHWDKRYGMPVWDGMHDGMETNINSRLTDNGFAGAPGVRPTFASYMYADALAIARTAKLAGDAATATEFEAKAAPLRKGLQDIQTFMVHTVATSQIRLVIDHDGDGRTGITELMAWEH